MAGGEHTAPSPAERAEQARAVLREWNGYDPTEAERKRLDAELDRRLAEATGRPYGAPNPEPGPDAR